MKTLRAWIVRLYGAFAKKRHDREFAEEIESHLALHIEDNLRAGMNPEEARRNALIMLGGVDRTFEEHRDRRSFCWIAELQRNLGYALRIAWKQKAFSATVIALLGVAIGANLAVFSYYNSLFLQPLPFPDSERLVDLDETAPQWNLQSANIDPADFYEWQQENQSFEAMGVYITPFFYCSHDGSNTYASTIAVTRDFPSVFQIQPVLGRGFLKGEDKLGGPKVAVLGYAFWQREFGGRPSVIGETIKLDGNPYTIVGIFPSNADYPQKIDIWTPLQIHNFNNARAHFLRGAGRLKRGVTLAQAQQDLARIHKSMITIRPANAITSPRLQFLRERDYGFYRTGLIMFQMALGIVLLIVCANVAGMLLARSESRSREMGIRTALGSSRAGIIRQLLTECFLLAIPGTLCGFLFGKLFLKLSILWIGELPDWVRLTIDIRVFAFCALLAGLATILFGLAPALQAARTSAQRTLHETSIQSSASSSKRRGLNGLMAGEIALAFTLLVGAGLLLRTWQKMQAVNPGIEVKNVLTFRIELPRGDYKQQSDWSRFFEQFMRHCRQLPGVLAVSGASLPPISSGYSPEYFEFEGAPPRPAGEADPMIPRRSIFPGYFDAMRISLLSGRDFTEKDSSGVVIVNESFARRFWPNADPIGKRIRYKDDALIGEWMTVIGMTRNNKEYGLDQPTRPAVYYNFNQAPSNIMYIVIRSTMDHSLLINSIRSRLNEMDPAVSIFNAMDMIEVVAQQVEGRRFISIVMSMFAAAALLIAAVGIYGVVSYNVGRRTHEIGIRMALGATRSQVLSIVVRNSARLIIWGTVFGFAGAVAASRLMRVMLFEVASLDALTYFIVSVLLIIIVVAASILPARRAASIDPVRALRSE